MRLYYHLDPKGNFGDDLNPWLWGRLLPDLLTGYCYHEPELREPGTEDGDLFVGTGTLLNTAIPKIPRKAVMGTGAGYGPLPDVDDHWTFYCVRGPLTAHKLGLDSRVAVTDGAALCSRLLRREGSVKHAFGFMPHVDTARNSYWRAVCEAAGVAYVDPGESMADVIGALQACEVVLTEAMHGAIVCDALGIPWVAVTTNPMVLPFKWADWCASMELEYRPTSLPSLWLPFREAKWSKKGIKWAKFYLALSALKRVCAKAKPTLSDRSVLDARNDELLERIERFKRDFAVGRYR